MVTHTLPPLNALRTFESVARLGGVRQAAAELCVTPPAVSHQIANLEDFLGAPLFYRRGRKLVLTDIARDYLIEISPSLEAIGRATTVASQRQKAREVLTLSAPLSLTTNWLVPKLGRFLDMNPGLDIRFLDRMTLDPDEPGIDLAIEYRFEPDPDFSSERILPDEAVPIAAPEFAEKHGLTDLASLCGVTLIETERRLTSWRTIIAEFEWSKTQRYINFSHSLHSFAAAEQGLGVALGNRANAEHLVASGKLCIPFDFDPDTVPPTPRYYVSTPRHKERLPRVSAFRNWLRSEV
ncbi:MAG: LysR substrate-binding domain-containing protein [Albidovulum sp.]